MSSLVRALFVATALLAFVLPAAAKRSSKAPPKLLVAFDRVMASCDVSDWGFIRRKTCKDPGVEKDLRKQEMMAGLKAALMTYCRLLGSKKPLRRALASYRISTMNYSKRMGEAADLAVFRCLVPRMLATKKTQHVRRLARAITYMGTALKQDTVVLEALAKHPNDAAKIAGYEALWAHGRLRVFPVLKKAVKDTTKPKLQVAAIKSFGFGDRPKPAEAKKVCRLLVPLMSKGKLNIASSAAYRVASVCTSKKHKDAVIKAARKMVKRGKLNLTYVSALRTTSGWLRKRASDKQRAAIIEVLKKALASKAVSPLTRNSALSAVYHIDKAAGKALAAKYAKDPERWVAQEAARILAR